MPFQIREAAEGDAGQIVATVREVYDEYGFTWEAEGYHRDLYAPTEHYRPPHSRLLVADSEGQILGCGGYHTFEQIAGEGAISLVADKERLAGTDCSLERLYVRPGARRMGIGRSLFEQIAVECAERGRMAMEIWSDKRFADAHRLYQRYGARQVAERVCSDPDQSPEWGLVLDLPLRL